MDEYTAGLFGIIVAVTGSIMVLLLVGLVAAGFDRMEGKNIDSY